MLRPDLQPLAGFETSWPILKPAGRFRSWLLILYDEYMVQNFMQAVRRKELRNNGAQYPL